jgi:formylglycine-generating enzyme required for sulfatase activity
MKTKIIILNRMLLGLMSVSFLILPLVLNAQTRGVGVRVRADDGSTKEISLYEDSHALIIGNSLYTNGWSNLAGVESDVVAVREALEKHGFQVEISENLTGTQFLERVRKFINDYGYEPNNRLLIYYAGHGHTLGSSGDNRELGYLVPVDAPDPNKDEKGFRQRAIPMDDIQNFAKKIQSKHAMFMFDSCFSGKLVTRNAIAVPKVIEEKVAYAVRQFITAGAADQPVPDESIFRRTFVRGLEGDADTNRDGYITGTELAEYLKEKVTNESNRTQTPQYGKIKDVNLDRGDFVFSTGKAPERRMGDSGPDKVDPNATERNAWEKIKRSGKATDFEGFLETFPNGIFSSQAKARYEEIWWEGIKDSSEKSDFENYLTRFPNGKYAAAATFSIKRMKSSGGPQRPEIKAVIKAGPIGVLKLPKGAEMRFAYIPEGEFYMGSENGDADEQNIRRVKISRGFAMGIHEVTQEQWQAVMGKNPSNFTNCGGQCPVENVKFKDIEKFIERLNKLATDGATYRLPTEAEWEYAARAGTTGDYAGDLDSMAWYKDNSDNKTHPVGQKTPNGWGLYDMHGNVWEWVSDWYDDYQGEAITDPTGAISSPTRVVRGGSWNNPASFQRSANRSNSSPETRFGYLGFRLVRIK